ncbi:hypothetical protein D3C86_1377290 [compost metagenome]
MIPPMAGPTLRVMLKPTLFSVTAAGKSSRGTISPTDACQDGLLSAVPQPIMKVKKSRSQGVSQPDQAKTVSSTEAVSISSCAEIMMRRRSKLSASAPEISENSMIGKEVEACTRAIMFSELESDVIIHAAPTAWISPPKFEARLATQIRL